MDRTLRKRAGEKNTSGKNSAFRHGPQIFTIFILGIILLVVSFITDLSLFYALYLIAAGAIGTIIGLVIRNIWEKNR